MNKGKVMDRIKELYDLGGYQVSLNRFEITLHTELGLLVASYKKDLTGELEFDSDLRKMSRTAQLLFKELAEAYVESLQEED